ncbi:MAG TPA: cell envelope integrity protein TolA [Gammaproteobacteria bacterium]|nr:cell envelope integrity protein TolA [Gammaproteobacteria bacterium]
MWQLVKEHPRSFVYALLAHLLLIIMLVINLDWATKPTPAGAPSAPVQAVVIDESKVNAEVERLKTEDQRKVQQEQAAAERLRELEAKTQQAEAARVKEQKKLETLKQKQVVEEKRLKEQESQRKLEQQKLATEQKKLEQKKLEQKKLEQKQAEQKQQAAEAEKKKQAEEKRLAEAEAKRKIEAEAKAKADAEAKAKADAEAKAKAAAEAQRKAAEQALQAQIAAEDAARDQSIISQYVGIIGDRVRRNWIQPPSSRVGLSCVVKVQLMPGGDVISAQVVQSSGDAAFDRSVEAAVYRAAPLPLPPDPGLFESFRTLTFNFSPK